MTDSSRVGDTSTRELGIFLLRKMSSFTRFLITTNVLLLLFGDSTGTDYCKFNPQHSMCGDTVRI